MINMRMDQVMIKNILDDNKVVGYYSAAIRISELWYFLPLVLGGSFYPTIINAKKISSDLYKKRITQSIKIMSIITLPAAISITFLSSFIVNLLYGSAYTEASYYLSYSIWISVPFMIFFITNKLIYLENLIKISFYISLFTAFSNIILNWVLINMVVLEL